VRDQRLHVHLAGGDLEQIARLLEPILGLLNLQLQRQRCMYVVG
jgi:hypothetical protein